MPGCFGRVSLLNCFSPLAYLLLSVSQPSRLSVFHASYLCPTLSSWEREILTARRSLQTAPQVGSMSCTDTSYTFSGRITSLPPFFFRTVHGRTSASSPPCDGSSMLGFSQGVCSGMKSPGRGLPVGRMPPSSGFSICLPIRVPSKSSLKSQHSPMLLPSTLLSCFCFSLS